MHCQGIYQKSDSVVTSLKVGRISSTTGLQNLGASESQTAASASLAWAAWCLHASTGYCNARRCFESCYKNWLDASQKPKDIRMREVSNWESMRNPTIDNLAMHCQGIYQKSDSVVTPLKVGRISSNTGLQNLGASESQTAASASLAWAAWCLHASTGYCNARRCFESCYKNWLDASQKPKDIRMREVSNWESMCNPICGLWVVGCGLWVVGCGLWVVGCGLWVVGCGLWVVGCGLWVAGCGLWVVGCGLWVVGCGS